MQNCFSFFAWAIGKWSSWLTVSVKTEINHHHLPPQKPTHPTHSAPTRLCVPHTWGEGRQGMRQWNLQLNIYLPLIFLLSLRHSKKEEEVSTTRYLASLPQNTTYSDASISNKIMNKSCLCTITGSGVIKQVNHPPVREERKITKGKV